MSMVNLSRDAKESFSTRFWDSEEWHKFMEKQI